ncbi:MAG: hypothetical protein IKD70_04055 [Eggerthellaceae bacterium]|nr:hypothetical protein [Eggerthellaceae bacterium]
MFERRCPLQDVVDALFGEDDRELDFGDMSPKEYREILKEGPTHTRFEVITAADTVGLSSELQAAVEALAPGDYTRVRLCINLNAILSARDLTFEYGTVK